MAESGAPILLNAFAAARQAAGCEPIRLKMTRGLCSRFIILHPNLYHTVSTLGANHKFPQSIGSFQERVQKSAKQTISNLVLSIQHPRPNTHFSVVRDTG